MARQVVLDSSNITVCATVSSCGEAVVPKTGVWYSQLNGGQQVLFHVVPSLAQHLVQENIDVKECRTGAGLFQQGDRPNPVVMGGAIGVARRHCSTKPDNVLRVQICSTRRSER